MRFLKFFSILLILSMLSNNALASGGGNKSDSSKAKTEKKTKIANFGYIDLDMITIPIITKEGLFQQFTFAVTLEVIMKDVPDVHEYRPRLADAYIQDLYGALAENEELINNHLVNIKAIKKRLKKVTDEVLGDDLKVNDVLIQLIFQKSIK